MMNQPFHVIEVTGFAGDRTPEAMAAVPSLAKLLAKILAADILSVGYPADPRDLGWQEALKESAATLRDTAGAVRDCMADLHHPAIVAPRCAIAIGSLPPLLAAYPDAILIWLDAHGDLQLPETSDSGYLGGMPISALLGRWESGYGMGASPDRLIHIGGRDLDPPEEAYLQKEGILHLSPRQLDHNWAILTERLAHRQVILHLDCDAFDPDEVIAEYNVPNGLTRDQVARLFQVIQDHSRLVGLEITEYSPRNEEDAERSLSALEEAFSPLAQRTGNG